MKLYLPVAILLLSMSLALIVAPRLDTPTADTHELASADHPLDAQSPETPEQHSPKAIDFDEGDDDETWTTTESYRRRPTHTTHSQHTQTFHGHEGVSLLHRPPIR